MSTLANVAVLEKLFREPLVCDLSPLSLFLLAQGLLEVYFLFFIFLVFFLSFSFLVRFLSEIFSN